MASMTSDNVGLNGSTPEWSEDEYRKVCRQLKRYQMSKRGSKRKSKPLLKPIGDINTLDMKVKVQKSPVDWDDIKIGMPFALDAGGTVLYTKTGKERAICLNTMSPVPVGGASIYRVFL